MERITKADKKQLELIKLAGEIVMLEDKKLLEELAKR